MADVAIVNRATVAAPKNYRLAATEEIILKAVRASFDGSGAAGAYLPCFQLVAPDGTVMLSAVPGAAIAAGASADVSWFPLIAGSSQTTIGPGPGCIYYVGPPSGVASADTAAIQAAHDALPASGGIVQLCRGNYALTTASPALSFTKPIWLQGHGRTQSTLTYGNSTGWAIEASADSVVFDHFGLIYNGAAATAGGGIWISGGGNRAEFSRIELTQSGGGAGGFYDAIFKQYGNGTMFDKVHIGGYVHAGIRLQNVADTDGGDDSVTNCQINARSLSGTVAGILWESGGNLRCVGNQLFGGVETDGSQGIRLAVLDGVNTSDFLLSANTVEEFAFCIAAAAPGSHTGKMQSLTAWGNEMFKLRSVDGACLSINMPVALGFQHISLGGNIMGGGQYGLIFGNVDGITYGPNVYDGQGTAASFNAGGSTGVLAVGGG